MAQDEEKKIRELVKKYVEQELNSHKNNYKKEFSDFVEKEIKKISKEMMTKDKIKELMIKAFVRQNKFMWEKSPNYAVFRNKNNKKWYGIIMNLNKHKLDNKTNSEIEIINVSPPIIGNKSE